MSQDNNNQDQSHVIGEMFDAANISQPAPQSIPGSVTPANIEIPTPRPELPPANNGFTTDNLQPPAPTSESPQESSDE